jgi:hypothetical protein
MKNEKCAICGQYVSPFFIREVKKGVLIKKVIKVCTLCLAKKQEGII